MPNFKLSTIYRFSASHFLTKYKGKCENLHGHNYKLIITIKGPKKSDDLVIDFSKIKKTVIENIIKKLDHSHLNDIIKNPSAENICVWIWKILKSKLPLNKITLFETEDCYCEYEGK